MSQREVNPLIKLVKQETFHRYLLILAFLLGLAFRMIRLGALPLGNIEANLAMQALNISRNVDFQVGSHVAYGSVTGLSFFIFNSSPFLARFWVALFGLFLVFVPALFKKLLGQWPATIASLLFAISPEMVGLSRIIGSPMMAMVFLLLFLGFFFAQKPVFAGMSLALGLMSGPGFWMGVFILSGSILLASWLFSISGIYPTTGIEDKSAFWTRFSLSFGFTLLMVGTGFTLSPSSLTGVFEGFVEFVNGFWKVYPGFWWHKGLFLLAYTFAGLLLGLWGSIRALMTRQKLDLFLSLWWAFGFVFLLLYRGAQPADMLWVSFPLWILASRVVIAAFRRPAYGRAVMFVLAIIVVVLFVFLLLMLRSLINPGIGPDDQVTTLIALIGALVLLVALILLVSFGWSEEVALTGLLIGLMVVACGGLISTSVSAMGLGSEATFELWYPNEPALQTQWMQKTIDQVLTWNASRDEDLEIAVSNFDAPGMRWALHSYDSVQFLPYASPQSQPGILITNQLEMPEISNAYRGQDLVWSHQALWNQMSPYQYLSWLYTRDALNNQTEIILWVRTDLMPDSQFSP